MKIDEMIKVMQHYANGGEVENKEKESNKWFKGCTPVWNWSKYDYRIKKEKRVVIEKWLCRDKEGDYAVIDSSNIAKFIPYTKVKLIKIYEVGL